MKLFNENILTMVVLECTDFIKCSTSSKLRTYVTFTTRNSLISSTTMTKRNYFLTNTLGDGISINDENNVNKYKKKKSNNNDGNECKENVNTDKKWKKRKRNENKIQFLFSEKSRMEGENEIFKRVLSNENVIMKNKVEEISRRDKVKTIHEKFDVKNISRTETFQDKFDAKNNLRIDQVDVYNRSRTKIFETIKDKLVPDVLKDMNGQFVRESWTKPIDICEYAVRNSVNISSKCNRSDHGTPLSSSDQTEQLVKSNRDTPLVPGVSEHIKHQSTPENYTKAIQTLNMLQSNAKELKKVERNRNNPKSQKEISEVLKYLSRLNVTVDDVRKLNVIHISGTKGKGSTSAYCESILRSHGYKTGFYSSPHLIEVRERIKLNGHPIGYEQFTKYFWHVYNTLYSQRSDENDMPAYFRFLTVMSFYVFLNEKIDVSIFEVGIGGLYDSTNIVPNTKIAGITSLGFDHTAVLGNTIEEIAMQKAGIMKPNCICVTSINQRKETLPILINKAKDLKCVLLEAPNILHYDWNGYEIDEDWRNTFQSINISLAIQLAYLWIYKMNKSNDVKQMVDKYFKSLNINVDTNPNEIVYEKDTPHKTSTNDVSLLVGPQFKITKEIYRGLKSCVWPGRVQIIYKNNFKYFLDGAHTSDSIAYCASWFQRKSKVEESKTTNGSSTFLQTSNRLERFDEFGANTRNIREKNDGYSNNQSKSIAGNAINLRSIQSNYKSIISDKDHLNTMKEITNEDVYLNNSLGTQTLCSEKGNHFDNSKLRSKIFERYGDKTDNVQNESPIENVQTDLPNRDIRIDDGTSMETNNLNEHKSNIVSDARKNCQPKVKRILVFNLTGERDSSKLLPPLMKCDFDYILITPNILSGNPDIQYGNNSMNTNNKTETFIEGLKRNENVPDRGEKSTNEILVNDGNIHAFHEDVGDKNETQLDTFKENIKNIRTDNDFHFGNTIHSSHDVKHFERVSSQVNANIDNIKEDQLKTFKDNIEDIKTSRDSSFHSAMQSNQLGSVTSQLAIDSIAKSKVQAADSMNLTSIQSDQMASVRNIVNVANRLNQNQHCRVILMNDVLETYNFKHQLDPSQDYHVLVTGSLHLVGAFLNVLSTH